MSAYPPVTDPELVEHIETVKYPAARAVIKLLNKAGIRVLHVGSPAFDPWLPPGRYYFVDLDLLLRESDLVAFRDTMDSAGYRLVLDNDHTGETTEAPETVIRRMLSTPQSPDISYAREVRGPVSLWVSFHTSWRHSQLLFVDLDHWFEPGVSKTITVMGDTEIERPPAWAMLLWQACEFTTNASDCLVTSKDLELLHLIATVPGLDWDQVLAAAIRYDEEYVARTGRIEDLLRAHAARVGVAPGEMVGADASLGVDGVLYGVRYAFEALEDFYPQTVPASVLEGVRTGTGRRPRKVWACVDPEWTERYGLSGSAGTVATASFGIRTQMEQYAGLTAVELLDRGLVTAAFDFTDSFSLWARYSEQVHQKVFAPL